MINLIWLPASTASLKIKIKIFWFGGYQNGLSYYDGQNLHHLNGTEDYYVLPGAHSNPPHKPVFWTTKLGLTTLDRKLNPRAIGQYNPDRNRDFVGYFIHSRKDTQLVLGLQDSGIAYVNYPPSLNSEWSMIGPDKGLDIGNTLWVEEDAQGRIWAGHPFNGIAMYDPLSDLARSWTYGQDQMYHTWSCASDQLGRLWFGTHSGLYLLRDPDQIHLDPESIFSHWEFVDIQESGNSRVLALDTMKGKIVYANLTGHGFIDIESTKISTSNVLASFTKTNLPFRGGASSQNAILIDSRNRLWNR